MMRSRHVLQNPCQLQALAILLISSAHGMVHTIQLHRKSASLDSNAQRRAQNVLYYGTVQLGTPGQELTVCPDTGSLAIWTAADTTPPTESGDSNFSRSYSSFVNNASSTFQVVGYNFSEKYKAGGVVGVLGRDQVQLGAITVRRASLGLVTQASVDLSGASCAGVLGLARPGLGEVGMAIFYRMLAEQGLLDLPAFSLWLNPEPAAEPAGSLTLGGMDASLHTGTLTQVPVISSKYWMVPLLGMQAGSVALPISARGATLDSSSALSVVTDRDFVSFERFPGVTYSRSIGAFQVIGGCANISALPNLTVAVYGYNLTLTPKQYVVQVAGSTCVLGIQPGAPDNTAVLGTAFLRAYFTAYTYNATSRSSYVSFSPAAPGNSTTARRRSLQELGDYPGDSSTDSYPAADQDPAAFAPAPEVGALSGSAPALPPKPAATLGMAAEDASRLGTAADQDALLAATLAAQAAKPAAPASAPASSTLPSAPAAAAPPRQVPQQPILTAAPTAAPPAALQRTASLPSEPKVSSSNTPAPAPSPSQKLFPAVIVLDNPTPAPALAAEVTSFLPASMTRASAEVPMGAPFGSPVGDIHSAPGPATLKAPVSQGIGALPAELFPEQVLASAPAQVPAQAPAFLPRQPSAAPKIAPQRAPLPAPVSQGLDVSSAELFPEQVVAAAPAKAPAPSARQPVPGPAAAPVVQGSAALPAELFPEQVPASAPPQALAPVSGLEPPGQIYVRPLAGSPAASPAQQAPVLLRPPAAAPEAADKVQVTAAGSATGPAPLPAAGHIPVYPLGSMIASAPDLSMTQPPQAAVTFTAAVPAQAPAPEAAQRAVAGQAAPVIQSSAAPALPPQLQPAEISIPVTPLHAEAPAPVVALEGAPSPSQHVASYSLPASGPTSTAPRQPADISIPVSAIVAAPATAPSAAQAPTPAPAASPAAMAGAGAPALGPADTNTQPVTLASVSLAPALAPIPATAAAPAMVPSVLAAGRAPAPAVSTAVSGAAAPSVLPPVPAAMPMVVAPAPAPATSGAAAPAMTPLVPAPGPSPALPAAVLSTPGVAPAPAPADAASAAVSGAPAPAALPPVPAPVPGPALSALSLQAPGLAPGLSPAGTINASSAADAVPPFQAIPGLEVLYGGLSSLWRLPLQLSNANDTMFSRYLATHPLTAAQNKTLAKPQPPTLTGFGQAVNLVVLDQYLDTCLVAWSSVNSCRAKGLNDTSCALMPVFDDVATLENQCPFKNETQVQLPVGSGNYVPISQQWLLVRQGAHGQQIYNTGLSKCLDICTEQPASASPCGHAGNVYLQDCDASSATQQWLLTPSAMANATLSNANTANLTMYQISSAYVPPVAKSALGEPVLTHVCMDTCEAERDSEQLPSAYGQTTCNPLLPTYPSSAAVFPCKAQRLPHSILQAFAIAFSPGPSAA